MTPLTGVFSRTPGKDKQAYFSALEQILQGFPAQTLRAAAKKLLAEATSSTWPLPAHAKAACQSAAGQVAQEQEAAKQAAQAPRYDLPDRVALRILVDQAPAMAVNAQADDWHVALLDFVKQRRQVPDLAQAEAVYLQHLEGEWRRAAMVAATLKLFERVGGTAEDLPPQHPVAVMAQAIATRRERIRTQLAQLLAEQEEMM
ncbi:hypothetical protein [Polycladidibacter hongkongensis]|uniref:hypothetical protein n=1 Tax=Polycladidibacter hongkongensis TaxID=1647556 RepID=UPI0012E35288|nr:hypothetical protein [Pseudovibrio hongkongensis]